MNKFRYKLDAGKMLGFRLHSDINSGCKSSGQYGAKISVKVGGKQPPAPAV